MFLHLRPQETIVVESGKGKVTVFTDAYGHLVIEKLNDFVSIYPNNPSDRMYLVDNEVVE